MVTHVAVGAESQADLQVGKELAQLQTRSSFLWIHYSGCPGKINFLGNQSEYIDDQYELPENICMHALQCICEGTGTEAEHRP